MGGDLHMPIDNRLFFSLEGQMVQLETSENFYNI